MTRSFWLGFALAPFLALPCIWLGQLQVNPQARLLLHPAAEVRP